MSVVPHKSSANSALQSAGGGIDLACHEHEKMILNMHQELDRFLR